MRISTLEAAFTRAPRNARAQWSERRAAYLGLFDGSRQIAQAECSPLPGYSPDSLPAAVEALAALELDTWPELQLLWQLTPASGPTQVGRVMRVIVDAVAEHVSEALPSARFGLELCLFDLACRRCEVSLWTALQHALLEPRPPHLVAEATSKFGAQPTPAPLAGLIDALHAAEALAQARRLIALGAHTLKFKLGRAGAWREEWDTLRALRDAYPTCRLRADANGCLAMNLPELRDKLDQLAALDLEFLEEPAPHPLLSQLGRTPIPLALDESLQGLHEPEAQAALLRRLEPAYLVLKPMALGLGTSMNWIRLARASGITAVLSHLFGGPMELTAGAHLSLAVSHAFTELTLAAQGLAPHAGLELWPPLTLPLHDGMHLRETATPGLGLPWLGASLEAQQV